MLSVDEGGWGLLRGGFVGASGEEGAARTRDIYIPGLLPSLQPLLMPTPSHSLPGKASGLQPRPVGPRDPKQHARSSAAQLCSQETKHKTPGMKEVFLFPFKHPVWFWTHGNSGGFCSGLQWGILEQQVAKVGPALLGIQSLCAIEGAGP